MSRYVDGFVLPVAKKNLARYRRIARVAGKVWREHGSKLMDPANMPFDMSRMAWRGFKPIVEA